MSVGPDAVAVLVLVVVGTGAGARTDGHLLSSAAHEIVTLIHCWPATAAMHPDADAMRLL